MMTAGVFDQKWLAAAILKTPFNYLAMVLSRVYITVDGGWEIWTLASFSLEASVQRGVVWRIWGNKLNRHNGLYQGHI